MGALIVNGSRRNKQSLLRIFHRRFLPSVTSFGLGVSEEKIKMWKLTDDRRWTTDWKKKSSETAWSNESKLDREHPLKILYKDYSFRSDSIAFGLGVSEEKIKMWKLTDDRRWTTDDGRQVMAKAHITFCKVS
jgi:predicted RNA-binding protein